ncbi:hypothetical protein [Micromonospora sp. Llam0]|nr:hypothetical protein [Micromonospora sp. Llam0]
MIIGTKDADHTCHPGGDLPRRRWSSHLAGYVRFVADQPPRSGLR